MANNNAVYRDPKWFARNLKRMTEIVNEPPRAEFYAGIRRDLLARCNLPLKKRKLQSVYGLLSSDLQLLSWESMSKGAIAILDDDQDGWIEMRRGLLYDCWSARLRHAFIVHDNCFDEAGNPASAALFEGKEALTFCHAIVTGDNHFAHGFGNQLLSNFEKTDGGDKVFFYTMPFFPFVLKLYSHWIGKRITFRPDVSNPLGRYQQTIDHWESPQPLASSLLDICDLHCEEAVDRGGHPAFAYHPYNLFPVEILAILRIRQQLRLETPSVIHPLLDSPLRLPPTTIPQVDDPLLDRVMARFQNDFPAGANCW